ncbi:Protein transport protein SEC7 [Varanus komodoensis]|nr:Protein transport protein SEC7 [Varanus komodoensis]
MRVGRGEASAGCDPGRQEPPVEKATGTESSVRPEEELKITHQEEAMELNAKEQPSSPQKQGVKARSKSTEDIQPAKKAFHTPQKSLPNQMDDDESKMGPIPARKQCGVVVRVLDWD